MTTSDDKFGLTAVFQPVVFHITVCAIHRDCAGIKVLISSFGLPPPFPPSPLPAATPPISINIMCMYIRFVCASKFCHMIYTLCNINLSDLVNVLVQGAIPSLSFFTTCGSSTSTPWAAYAVLPSTFHITLPPYQPPIQPSKMKS